MATKKGKGRRRNAAKLTQKQQALVEQFERYPEFVLGRTSWAVSVLGWEEALDVARMALVIAARNYKEGIAKFTTYAYRCISSQLIRAAQRAYRAGEVMLVRLGNDDMSDDIFGEPGKFFDDQDTLLGREVARLDKTERKVLSLLFFQNMTLEEAGKVVGRSKERVRQVRNRALGKLRGRLSFEEGVLTCRN